MRTARDALAVSAMSAAKRLCEVADWKISNLELQKLLYISHMLHLGKTGQPLIDGWFEAWDYGPVQPEVYRSAKAFGRSPVGDVFTFTPRIAETAPEAQTIREAVEQLGGASPARLVSITHWEKGAWAKHYVPGGRGNFIPDQDILQEYRDRVRGRLGNRILEFRGPPGCDSSFGCGRSRAGVGWPRLPGRRSATRRI